MKLAVALSTLLCASHGVASEIEQTPLQQDGIETAGFDLIYEYGLKKAEIIPTVIDSFKPFINVNITWPNATAKYGNTINPDNTRDQPRVTLYNMHPRDSIWSNSETPQLTVALTDPDAPSRDDPEWSEICHWIATEISVSRLSSVRKISSNKLKEVMPYKPPGPPPKTGKHRYVFVALAPMNGTTERLHLEKPGDRQHWGYEKERQGLRIWAEENGLGVVGANFIYEQNDEQ